MRSSAPVATSHTSQAGSTRRSARRQLGHDARRRRHCRWRPGAFGRRVGMRHHDPQAARGRVVDADHVARATLPGTRKRCTTTRRPARVNDRFDRAWARPSARLAAGRGPASARRLAMVVGVARRRPAAAMSAAAVSAAGMPAPRARSPGAGRRSARTRTRRRGRPPRPRPSSSGTPSGSPPGEHDVRAEGGRAPPPPAGAVVGAARATSRVGERWKSSAWSRWAKAWGWRGRERMQEAQHADRAALVVVLAGERGQAQQPVRGARVAGRDRMVLGVLAAGHQALVVRGGLEEAAALLVGEALDHRVRQLARGGEPARLERRLVQGEQRLEQEGVVLEVGVQPRLARP